MNLTNDQCRRLHQALLSAFPTFSKLAQMVRFRLDENLQAIAGGDNLGDAAFKLIEWTEAKGRLVELVHGAYAEAPGNPALQEIAGELFPGGSDPPVSTSDTGRGPRRSPGIISLPYRSLDTLFKGREQVLADLRESLTLASGSHATAIVGRAVHGLGGVGKTRLAVEYAWRHVEEYSALLFVPADTPAELQRNLAGLAGPLVLNLPEQEASEEVVRVAAVLRWLREHPGWLLILDNADTPEAAAAAEALLAHLQGGHVLITSRISQWSAGIRSLELDVLEESAAAQFLLERTTGRRRTLPSDAEDAAELAHELGGLALALEQAAAYVTVRRISLAEYLRAWRAHEAAVQEWYHERLMQYPRSVAQTWQTTLDQLGPGEIVFLRLVSWLAPEPLPLWVLDGEQAEEAWSKAVALLAPELLASGGLRAALARLADFSMVRWDVEAETVFAHRVVQEIVRTQLAEAERQEWLRLSLQLLNAVLPGDPTDVRTWPRWNPLRPHVAAAVAQGDAVHIGEPTSRLMNELGLLLHTKALHAAAEPLLRRALVIDEARFGPDHPTVAISLNNLAGLLQETNRLVEAEPLLRRALVIDEASFGPDHPTVALRLNNLAQLLQDTNRLAEAEPLLRRALALGEQNFGPDHPTVTLRLNNLAGLLQDTNRLAEAEPLLRRALVIDEASFGPDHPTVALRLNNLAQLLQETNRLTEAEPLSRRQLQILVEHTRLTGHPHRHLNAAVGNYAGLLQAMRWSEARIRAELDGLCPPAGLSRAALELHS